MAEFTYGAVLTLIRVMERGRLDDRWIDFLYAYGLADVGVEPPRGTFIALRSSALGFERMKRLTNLGRILARSQTPKLGEFFARLTESVFVELVEPGRDRLGHKAIFLRDPEAARRDLEVLSNELTDGGYWLDEAG